MLLVAKFFFRIIFIYLFIFIFFVGGKGVGFYLLNIPSDFQEPKSCLFFFYA